MLTAIKKIGAALKAERADFIEGEYVTFPSEGLCYSCDHYRKTNTPDIAYLEQYERVLLFCYGREMKGHAEHEVLGENKTYHGTIFTESDYIVWRKRLGKESYPIAIRTEETGFGNIRPARLKGELYAVSPNTIVSLDNSRENGKMFRRKRISLIYPYRERTWAVAYGETHPDRLKWIPQLSGTRLQTLEAWAYVGRKTYWDDVIDNGYSFTTVNQYNPGGQFALQHKYYYFNKKEYE